MSSVDLCRASGGSGVRVGGPKDTGVSTMTLMGPRTLIVTILSRDQGGCLLFSFGFGWSGPRKQGYGT